MKAFSLCCRAIWKVRRGFSSRIPFTAGVLAGSIVSVSAQSVPPALYLTFDEGAGTVAHDSSNYQRNATLQGAAGWSAGIVGPFALNLPGSSGSYADVPLDAVNATQSFTVAAWVKLNSLGGFQTFVSEDSGYQSAFFLQKRADTNTFCFTLPLNGAAGPGTPLYANSGITPVVGQWYHLAGVYDANAHTASIYVNGALAGSTANVNPSAANGHTGIGHGQYSNSYVDWVSGSIDDVRLYAAALAAADVQKIAQSIAPVLYLTFDEGSGTTALDSSTFHRSASLIGGAGWTNGFIGSHALSLSGTAGAYADVPADVVDPTQSFSVAAWVKLTSVGGFQTFVSEDSGFQSAFFLQKRADTNTFTFTLPANGVSGPGTPVYADSGITPVANRWYHLAGVYDASARSASIYVNGVLANSISNVNPSPANGHTGIGHGQYANSYVDWVSGAIDDVRVYAAALSAASVQQIAQAVPPALYLTFDEGTGTVAHDSSNYQRNANLVGAAGWTSGIVGPSALNLPGSSGSYVDVPLDAVDPTQSFTVAAWVKLNSAGGFQTFVSEDSGYQSAFFLQKRADTNTFTFTLPLNGSTGPGTPVYADSGFVPVTGQWYHLAGVYDASAHTASIYVNGALANSISNVTPSPANGHTGIGHGQYANNYVDWVSGAIDDVRLYPAALNAAAVLAVARVGNPALTGVPTVPTATLQIDGSHPGPRVSPTLYGLMIEEINHSLDGGLYAEMVQNRVLQDNQSTAVHWSLVQQNGGVGSIALDTTQPVSGTVLTNSLRVSVSQGQRVGAANDGYWGFAVTPGTTYNASFWAKAAPGFTGPLRVDIESTDGSTIYAQAQVNQITTSWAKYMVQLPLGSVPTLENARYVISASNPGTFWLTQVSLFRPTYNGRPNGNRIGLMNKILGLKPQFLRLPGGNYLEGNSLSERFQWKKTIGPIEQRPGHQGPWGYRSDDGFGLLEYLEWCEDLSMQPLLAVFSGFTLDGNHVNPGTDLAPYVQEALDEIQYVTGSTTTIWGAQRAANGHAAPFALQYVEIGNEDWFDASGSYDARFAQFYDAIKQAYPYLQVIATASVSSRVPDVVDEHYYNSPAVFEGDVHHYDSYSRTGPKIMVGEWASQEGTPTPDWNAALGDAAWLTGLERNSDVVVLEAYAPQLVNVNPGASQWPTNLIGYDALNSYGSPSYYVQVMFSNNHGDTVLPATLNLSSGSKVYASVTRDSTSGTVYLKLVNTVAAPQPLNVVFSGAGGFQSSGTQIVLSGNPQDTNDINHLNTVVPKSATVNGLGQSFSCTLAPWSVTVLKLSPGSN